MLGNLFIVATPIGNLEDITLRALRILKEVDIIIAEDTRVSGHLLKYYEIFRPTLSYHQHSGEEKKLQIMNFLLDGKNIALVTDAGTPGISDPGNELIDYLLSYQPDLKIIPIPGASAITTALSASGFTANEFVFIGFMPKKKKTKLVKWLKVGEMTFAFYESPHRLTKTLKQVEEEFGNVNVFIGRELTKMHETLYRGKIGDVIKKLSGKIKGEVVVVVEV
ncbi:MAG: Ribosomal RNA small subunit methyltransferase I [Candidatus Woesebacteria bacterium GW2011_GWA1_37_8]|uniref:Ribosomal RNA small subunit methyltransferase I n=2 Tax=Candidatus Woeseibacteriota TaxID=1752722 RepID=A0A0G0NLY5_9BACT|nr:MAG: Ribosomal RNA small subunit methyltransferase I [Microgenomates group bacterium GW2011_GWC1_37_12b]KKQ44038.1 MAG: Ribosomal RNA small subunit methyltransferase I [Candidatus Woesebacteria bacterium GW2011_GWA1_37_8]KKQ86934.1 MAG: Ribosomal RNA small subunit methyltransferase I [Candidatus Woesebacteria bacterium GW2011_GWB1_38_8b]